FLMKKSNKKEITRKEYNKRTTNSRGSNVRKVVQDIKKELHGFAKTRWGRLWVDRMLGYGRPFRMQRGIRYAQEERLSNITISPGMIFATVQGTAPTPYRVKVLFDTIPDDVWNQISMKIAEKAYYTIKLLENSIPEDFERIFEELGYDLFPNPTTKLNASCSCPDKEIPCKHIAATVLYVARVFDFDPFLLLKLRGKAREELLCTIKHARSCANEPISISVKKIRKMVNIAEKNFEVPILPAQEIDPSSFIQPKAPYQIGFRFTKPTSEINILETLNLAPNLEKPDQFYQVFRELYVAVSQKAYKMVKHLKE
ncbi:MAG: SWIM zinc finger family protein, partial [Promethearchaeota archaeon]